VAPTSSSATDSLCVRQEVSVKAIFSRSLIAAVIIWFSGCTTNNEAELRSMVVKGVEKAKSEGMQFLQSPTVQVEIVANNKRATVTLRDSGVRPRPSWGPDLTKEALRWETAYEFYYVYDGRWKLTGGKTKSKDRVVLDSVPVSLSKYFDP
jgi:hypothetical protein